jgi:hypothetical protein
MHGMSGWESVVFFPREWNAAEVSAHGLPVRSLLIEDRLKKMGKERRRRCAQQDVVACAAAIRTLVPAVEPPSGGEQAKNMLIGAPGQGPSGPFRARIRMVCHGICYPSVSFCRSNRNPSHR